MIVDISYNPVKKLNLVGFLRAHVKGTLGNLKSIEN